MNIYKSVEDIEKNENTVLTIGTFDGVHKGHKVLFEKLKQYFIDTSEIDNYVHLIDFHKI